MPISSSNGPFDPKGARLIIGSNPLRLGCPNPSRSRLAYYLPNLPQATTTDKPRGGFCLEYVAHDVHPGEMFQDEPVYSDHFIARYN
ncbi:MAG TPA: hypothetical protein PKA58_32745, partial [Polyangium sp.]|nr:hypothetical protein [Polyangium sp.]